MYRIHDSTAFEDTITDIIWASPSGAILSHLCLKVAMFEEMFCVAVLSVAAVEV